METNDGWGRYPAIWALVVVALVILAFWWCNKSGQDKADLAASVQRLYGKVDCVTPMVEKYAERVDAIGVALGRTAQAQADFQSYASNLLGDLDNAVFAPRCGNHSGGNGCGQTRFVKSTPYTAGTTTLEETDTCCNG
jgi:hypothetical protein